MIKRFLPIILMFATTSLAQSAEPTTKPVRYTGPSASSLATPYSGPLKFSPRVLAAERRAAHVVDADARASTWRYYYSVPRGYGFYGYGYRFGYHRYGHYRPFGRGLSITVAYGGYR